MQSLGLEIDGMSCGHCVQRVSKALTALRGVQLGEVKVGSAKLSYDPAAVTADAIARALDDAGYPSRPVGG